MLWSSILAAALVGGPGNPAPTVTVAIDSGKKELTITAGPFDLPNMPPMEDHAMMDFGMSHDTPIQQFEWPIDGWFRGFRLELTDKQRQSGSPGRHPPHDHGELQPPAAASIRR